MKSSIQTSKIQSEIKAMANAFPVRLPSGYYEVKDRAKIDEILARFDFKDKTVLEIGAFAGWLSYKIRKLGGVCFLTDIFTGVFPDFFDGCAADKGALPFRDRTWDFVVCRDTLHHGDLAAGVHEAHRVLKPGGVFICTREPCISSKDDEQAILLRDCQEELDIGIDEHRPNILDYTTAFKMFETIEFFNSITLKSQGDIDYGGSGLSIIGRKKC